MLRFVLRPWSLCLTLLLFSVPTQAQTTIASQGFEGTASDDWTIASGAGNVSSAAGAGDTPASERIRTGTHAWQVNNATATLEFNNVTVTGYTGVQVTLYLSSTTSVDNGADGGDRLEVYAALNNAAFPSTPDLTIQGNNNAVWGYSATTTSTTAGTPLTVQPGGGGDRSMSNPRDDYSTLVIDIPNGTNSVALQIVGINNRLDELWNVDDVTLTGTPTTTETRVQFVSVSDEVAEGDTGTKSYDLEVSLINPDATSATTATVAIIGGDATAGSDYVFSGGTPDEQTVTFPAGSAANQVVTLTVNGDTDVESGETLIFELQNVSGGDNAAAGSPSQFTLTLLNDDAAPSLNAWINEFHYDNESDDINEFVEVAVPTSFTDFANLEVVRYEGGGSSSGTVDGSIAGTGLTKGATQGDFTLYYWEPSALENGGSGQSTTADGLALCYNGTLVTSGGVAQLLSYENTFTASAGCASGTTSTDVGVSQGGFTVAGSSLGLAGNGDDYSDFAWTAFDDPDNGNGATKGTPNMSQSLPVELVSFEAVAGGASATLAWTTAAEESNAGFHVEHRRATSDDDENTTDQDAAFSALGFVEGRGTTSEVQSYRFQTGPLEAGRHVFRLRQVDFDGAVSYSGTVELAVASAMPEGFRLGAAYPNPFNPRSVFELEVAQSQRVEVSLFDVLGRRVAVLFEGVVESGVVQQVEIEGGSLPSGLYLYRAEGERFEATRQVSLIK